MSYWVEILCDVPTADRDFADRDDCLVSACHSDRNDSPMAKSISAVRAAKEARREAFRLGWKRNRSGLWICPGCLKHGLTLARKRGAPVRAIKERTT